MTSYVQNPHFRHVCTILVLPLFLVFLKLFCRNLWKSGRKSRWLRLMCIHNSFINLKMRVNLNTCTYVEHITYQGRRNRGMPPQLDFGRNVNPIPIMREGADQYHARRIATRPLDFQTFLRLCIYVELPESSKQQSLNKPSRSNAPHVRAQHFSSIANQYYLKLPTIHFQKTTQKAVYFPAFNFFCIQIFSSKWMKNNLFTKQVKRGTYNA